MGWCVDGGGLDEAEVVENGVMCCSESGRDWVVFIAFLVHDGVE